jgi:NAD(P)-dependent dehydrogenase (short-subunit alcohol dehydrogenase family)
MNSSQGGRLKNKCALVMGATSGIGQTCAEMFAQQGARVVLTGRRVTEGEEVARNIVAAGGDAIFQACDVAEPESVKEAVRQAVARFGQLDIVLNNAGGSANADGPVLARESRIPKTSFSGGVVNVVLSSSSFTK